MAVLYVAGKAVASFSEATTANLTSRSGHAGAPVAHLTLKAWYSMNGLQMTGDRIAVSKHSQREITQ